MRKNNAPHCEIKNFWLNSVQENGLIRLHASFLEICSECFEKNWAGGGQNGSVALEQLQNYHQLQI
jgi:hypothetical protein